MEFSRIIEALGELDLAWPDASSARIALGQPLSAEHRRRWQQLLRQAYGYQALAAGYALFGRDLRLTHLAKLQPHAQAWVERIAVAPRMAPLLAPFARVKGSPPADLGQLRQEVLHRGLKPAAWKWLYRQPRETVGKLLAFGWTAEAIFWINLLATTHPSLPLSSRWLESGRPYGLDLHYQYVLAQAEGMNSVMAHDLLNFLRLHPASVTERSLVEHEMLATAILVGWQNSKWTLHVQPNHTWKGLLTRQRQFNDQRIKEAQAARKQTKRKVSELTWAPRLGTLTVRGVQVRELCSEADLIEEGAALAHCVGDGAYLEGCLSGDHVIFNISEPQTRSLATLQLRRHVGNGWTLAQLSGPGNTRVPGLFWAVAREVQTRMSA